jgi:hypothetical protein
MMLAHVHGQVWNGADIARSLGVNEHTVRRYLDVLSGTYVIRQLPPWFENISKRQYKAPKVYVRDSGLLHALLGAGSWRELSGHPSWGPPGRGSRWSRCSPWRTAPTPTSGARTREPSSISCCSNRGRRYGIEFKYGDAPRMTKSLHIGLADLELDRVWIVYPGGERYPAHARVEVLPLAEVPDRLAFLGGPARAVKRPRHGQAR